MHGHQAPCRPRTGPRGLMRQVERPRGRRAPTPHWLSAGARRGHLYPAAPTRQLRAAAAGPPLTGKGRYRVAVRRLCSQRVPAAARCLSLQCSLRVSLGAGPGEAAGRFSMHQAEGSVVKGVGCGRARGQATPDPPSNSALGVYPTECEQTCAQNTHWDAHGSTTTAPGNNPNAHQRQPERPSVTD